MNEIRKENDIFVSQLLNPNASTFDLIANGITAENTGLLTPDVYKDSDFVKSKFSDQEGNFDEQAFDDAYLKASKQYETLAMVDSYDSLVKLSTEYDEYDLLAPMDAKRKRGGEYTISKIDNPYNYTKSLTYLNGIEESDKSARELAQKEKVWDSKEQKWLDYSVEDLGLLGSLFNTESYVYATWDEDGEHFDENVGRTVEHKKGQMKTKDGHFYIETAGDKEGYGKQFVALSDVLTREDSWLNQYDFFDSDGKDKSAIGTTFKLVAQIAPYLIPGFGEYWGLITGTVAMAGVLPTFAK